jgi:nicotinamidase-related amidase
MQSPVLIVIDMLNDFFSDWDQESRAKLCSSINQLVDAFRSKALPIIWVRQEFEPDLSDAFAEMRAKDRRKTIKGTSGCQILPELSVHPEDDVVVKKRYSAFFRTNLDEILAKYGPDTLIFVGINTHACIRTAVIDAYQRDWPVVIALDCVDSWDKEHHQVSLRYMIGKLASGLHNSQIVAGLKSGETESRNRTETATDTPNPN